MNKVLVSLIILNMVFLSIGAKSHKDIQEDAPYTVGVARNQSSTDRRMAIINAMSPEERVSLDNQVRAQRAERTLLREQLDISRRQRAAITQELWQERSQLMGAFRSQNNNGEISSEQLPQVSESIEDQLKNSHSPER